MRTLLAVLAVAVLAAVAFAGGAMWWDIDAARMASGIEIKIHSNGTVQDVEYHVPVASVPTAVRTAMKGLYADFDETSADASAEKEYEGGELFFELAWKVGPVGDKKKHEVMFTPGGEVHSKEIELDWGDATYGDLTAIKTDLAARYGVTDLTCEVILDAADQPVEFHVKLVTDPGTPTEQHHKLIVAKDGFLTGAYLEVVSEIEVPMTPR